MSQCQVCQKEIIWIVTDDGRSIPCEASPSDPHLVVHGHGYASTHEIAHGRPRVLSSDTAVEYGVNARFAVGS
jgi:hypothetical protein